MLDGHMNDESTRETIEIPSGWSVHAPSVRRIELMLIFIFVVCEFVCLASSSRH